MHRHHRQYKHHSKRHNRTKPFKLVRVKGLEAITIEKIVLFIIVLIGIIISSFYWYGIFIILIAGFFLLSPDYKSTRRIPDSEWKNTP